MQLFRKGFNGSSVYRMKKDNANQRIEKAMPNIENNRYEALKLDNQLCFSLYVCSKEIIKKYKPLLEPYKLTYTGYIVMMALWEKDNITVKNLGSRLYLDSGTLTPVLKKLEALDYIKRVRSNTDERNVYIQLTGNGADLREKALPIPNQLICSMNLSPENGKKLLDELHQIMHLFTNGS